jgi:flavin reductase (DIM6/NTAB) family NADH-FMN oxidoreductase RutF
MPVSVLPSAAAAFRSLFRQHAGGVVVVTLDAGTGPAGFTATSLTSVSLDPPMATVAISNTSSTWPGLRAAPSVVVNFLDHDQHEIAGRFATSGIDRFAPPTHWHRLDSGEPVLDESRRWMRATVRDRIAVGDHHVVVLQIEQIELGDEAGSALVYHCGTYHPIGHLHA